MGHVPDWARGSMKKTAPSANTGIRQRPIFHSEVKGYADGGEVSNMTIPKARAGEATQQPSGATAFKVDMPQKVERYKITADGLEPAQPRPTPSQAQPASSSGKFGDAFAAARKSGLKEFEWNGKKYNTKLKGEDSSPSKKEPESTGSVVNGLRVDSARSSTKTGSVTNFGLDANKPSSLIKRKPDQTEKPKELSKLSRRPNKPADADDSPPRSVRELRPGYLHYGSKK